jgi:hypothetical protein
MRGPDAHPGRPERPSGINTVTRSDDLGRPGLAPAWCALSLALLAGAGASAATPAAGPLRPLEPDPRYFTDGSGKAVLLAGSHSWGHFQDNGHRRPAAAYPRRAEVP